MERAWRVVPICVGFVLGIGTAGCGGSTGGNSGAPDVAAALTGSRWWATTTTGHPLVVHWTDADHSLWTLTDEVPLQAQRNGDGSSTLTAKGTEQYCYVARTTDDPDAIALWACSAGNASDPRIGLLRRGAQLVREIPRGEQLQTSSNGQTSVEGIDPTGRWVVFAVGNNLSLWKSDIDKLFDLGSGSPLVSPDNRAPYGLIEFSPDGRYVSHMRSTDDQGGESLVVFDTTTATESVVEPRLDARSDGAPTGGVVSTARFSPDSRRIVFYGNLQADGVHSDLVFVDLKTGERVTLIASTVAGLLYDCLWFTRSNHIAFCDLGGAVVSNATPIRSYELSTGTEQDLGTVTELVESPDGSYLALTTFDGAIQLFEDDDWKPRSLGSAIAPNNPIQNQSGLTAGPDGRLLAFTEGNGAFHVYDTRAGTMSTTTDGAGCIPWLGTEPNQELATLARSAFFLSDGQTLLHPLGACGTSESSGVARYDLATGQEQIAMLDAGTEIVGFGPVGEVVYGSTTGGGVHLLSWSSPTSPVPLTPADYYMFTADDRYLLGFGYSDISVRDLASGTTTDQPVQLHSATAWANPQTGVTLVEGSGGVFTNAGSPGAIALYPPTAPPMTLAQFGANAEGSPSGSAVVYSEEGAPFFVRLDPTATPMPIGNHDSILGISDRFVFFQDLDGICAFSF